MKEIQRLYKNKKNGRELRKWLKIVKLVNKMFK